MKRTLIVIIPFLLAWNPAIQPLLACGDKFLVVSRGTRFERSAVRPRAAILLYASPNSPFGNMAAIEAVLMKVGYRVTTVATEADFTNRIAAGPWDLIVADIAVVRALPTRLSRPGSAVLLPVVAGSAPAEIKLAKREFNRVVKLPSNSQTFLQAIDEALSSLSRPGN